MEANLQDSLKQRIETELAKSPILLFMKGDRSFPQCGYSARVVEILEHMKLDYSTFDILADPEMREGLKTFSSWKTFPQLYVQTELVGGCDIIASMFQTGELQKMLSEKGLVKAS